MKRAIILLAATALLTGCGVSKQLYEESENNLALCQGDLATCGETLSTCQGELEPAQEGNKRLTSQLEEANGKLSACEAEKGPLQEQLAQSKKELDGCKSEIAAAKKVADEAKRREEELRKKLGKELDDKTVEIERLQGKLAVRVLDKLIFDTGSADVRGGGKAVLDKVADVVADGNARIRVEGHTDDTPIGSNLKDKWFSNWELSAARASSVVRYFQYGRMIDPARMEAVGMASTQPLGDNATPEGRDQNRRVEIILTGAK